MNPGYLAWRSRHQLRQQEADLAVVETDAAQALADAAAAQSDATTGIGDAATAQTTADTALSLAESVEVTTEALADVDAAVAVAASRAVAPLYSISGGGLTVTWYVPGPSDAVKYQVNGGGYSTYTTPITLSPGDTIEAYNEKAPLTDSFVTSYDA
jgi:hypothetical protein